MAERGDPLSSVFKKDGTIADTVEEIEETLLKHNEDILKRKHISSSKQILYTTPPVTILLWVCWYS